MIECWSMHVLDHLSKSLLVTFLVNLVLKLSSKLYLLKICVMWLLHTRLTHQMKVTERGARLREWPQLRTLPLATMRTRVWCGQTYQTKTTQNKLNQTNNINYIGCFINTFPPSSQQSMTCVICNMLKEFHKGEHLWHHYLILPYYFY